MCPLNSNLCVKFVDGYLLFQTSDILYYEVLDIPLPELQGLKTLKVAFHHATKEEVSIQIVGLKKINFVRRAFELLIESVFSFYKILGSNSLY